MKQLLSQNLGQKYWEFFCHKYKWHIVVWTKIFNYVVFKEINIDRMITFEAEGRNETIKSALPAVVSTKTTSSVATQKNQVAVYQRFLETHCFSLQNVILQAVR